MSKRQQGSIQDTRTRTTMLLDSDLYLKLRLQALKQGKTATDIFNELLDCYINGNLKPLQGGNHEQD